MPRIYKREDHTGKTFGRLTILEELPSLRVKNTNVRVAKVQCECGTQYTARIAGLISGSVHSCGCAQKESAVKVCTERNLTHGDSGSKEHCAWKAMKARCYNNNRETYSYYGNRGIEVCPEWRDNYETFLRDMGRAPDDNHIWTVGRQNNDEDYSPANCHWEVWTEQARNRGMQENNISGFTGVSTKMVRGILHYRACWRDHKTGKQHEKIFSTNKYGVEAAKRMAAEHRQQMIDEMNVAGAGYKPEHGQPRKVKGHNEHQTT